MKLKVYMYDPKNMISQLCLWYLKKRKVEIVQKPQQTDVAFDPRFLKGNDRRIKVLTWVP